ncbi:hypothetical protein B7767_33190 [Streptomyces sp. 13-12-16]|nr:hypothetical protein B7767_33190 [Streptomyces sp. 13-12-16]
MATVRGGTTDSGRARRVPLPGGRTAGHGGTRPGTRHGDGRGTAPGVDPPSRSGPQQFSDAVPGQPGQPPFGVGARTAGTPG